MVRYIWVYTSGEMGYIFKGVMGKGKFTYACAVEFMHIQLTIQINKEVNVTYKVVEVYYL